MSLVITGASGHLGRRAAELLLEADGVDPADVVLVTRDVDALADLAARGAVVRHGDFADAASLADAFAGASRVLLVSTDVVGPGRVELHRTAIAAARDAGASLIAYTSLPNPVEGNPAMVAVDHRATEEALAASDVPWTFLRNALYAEYRVPEAQGAVARGEFHHNLGDGRTAYVSREDCAAAAAAVLAGGDEHVGKAYDITGPALVGAEDLARIYGEVGGVAVTPVGVDDDAFAAGVVAAGVPAAAAPLLVSFGRAIREGWLDRASGDVEALTGRPPAALRDVLAGALAKP